MTWPACVEQVTFQQQFCSHCTNLHAAHNLQGCGIRPGDVEPSIKQEQKPRAMHPPTRLRFPKCLDRVDLSCRHACKREGSAGAAGARATADNIKSVAVCTMC